MIIYKKLQLENLELGKKYKFYRKNKAEFNGVLYGLTPTTIILKNYQSDNITDEPTCVRIISKDLIEYAESEKFKIKINNFLNN